MKQTVGGDGRGYTKNHPPHGSTVMSMGEKVEQTVGGDGEWERVHEVVVTQ